MVSFFSVGRTFAKCPLYRQQARKYASRYVEDYNPYVWGTPDYGSNLLHNPLYNKGSAFSNSERERMGLRGLLPPAKMSMEDQERRVMNSLDKCHNDVDRYTNLANLMDRNETLYYHVVSKHLKELAPVIYTPTVGVACQKFSALYRRSRGMYFTPEDKNDMHGMVYNWPCNDVDVIVVTDGSRILGLGDLGCQGMGIPIGKLALYVAAGGVNPGKVLPIQLDFGTNNKALLEDPLYIGRRTPRINDGEMMELMEEFISAVTARWPEVFIQFEDFSSDNAFRILDKFRHSHLVFNDDIQGTGAVALAGIMGFLRMQGLPTSALKEQRIVCLGGGSAGLGVCDAIKSGMITEGHNEVEAAENFYLVDKDGLIGYNRASEKQQVFAKPTEHDQMSLLEVIKKVKPTILLGLSGAGGTFTQEIISEVAKHCERPLICPMSNPTSQAECTAEQAFQWSEGRAVVATGTSFPSCEYQGKTLYPSQGNNMYIFPGLGLMSVIARPSTIPDSMLHVAACALADTLTEENLKNGQVYPDLERIKEVSKAITVATCEHAWDINIARNEKPESIKEVVDFEFYTPEYQPVVRLDSFHNSK